MLRKFITFSVLRQYEIYLKPTNVLSFHCRTNVPQIIFINYLYRAYNITSLNKSGYEIFYNHCHWHSHNKTPPCNKNNVARQFEIVVKDLPFLKTLRTPSYARFLI